MHGLFYICLSPLISHVSPLILQWGGGTEKTEVFLLDGSSPNFTLFFCFQDKDRERSWREKEAGEVMELERAGHTTDSAKTISQALRKSA